MADKKSDSKINQHKKLAMGMKVTGKKSGGAVCAPKMPKKGK